MTRERLEKKGYRFSWGYSAYSVCVWLPNGERLGTFSTRRPYAIPYNAMQSILETKEAANV